MDHWMDGDHGSVTQQMPADVGKSEPGARQKWLMHRWERREQHVKVTANWDNWPDALYTKELIDRQHLDATKAVVVINITAATYAVLVKTHPESFVAS